ncbi:MAG: SDR family oxidoreductase [Burkholderiaceae bacterium]
MSSEANSGLPPSITTAERYRSIYRPDLFQGRTVVVTGGGSGLGRCVVHELASLGARVAILGRKPAKLDAVAAELAAIYPESAGRVSLHACDIREEDAVRRTVAEIVVRHGGIDGVFNCAGGQYPAALRDITAKGWDAVVRTNLHGTFLVSREVYTQWMEGHGGSIVNMLADIWGGLPGMGHSGAARGGVLTLTETCACEWAHSGVRVNAVAPGWIAASGMDSYAPDYQREMRGWQAHVPMRRFGTEAELSAAVVFLLSEASTFVNGTVIRVDGGVPNARPQWKRPAAERSPVFQGFPQYRRPGMLDRED